MASLLEKIKIMEASGMSQSRIDDYKNSQISIMQGAGMSSDRINTTLGITDAINDDEVIRPMKLSWSTVAKGMGFVTGAYPVLKKEDVKGRSRHPSRRPRARAR